MSKPPGQVFAKAPRTTVVKHVTHMSPIASLSNNLQLTVVQVPLNTMGSVQITPSSVRNSIVITVPIDGKPIYVGVDSNVSAETGTLVTPGLSFEIAGYLGPIYIVSSNGVSQVFTSVT